MLQVGENATTILPVSFRKIVGRVIEANNESVRLCDGKERYYAANGNIKKTAAIIAMQNCGSCGESCSFRRSK